MAVGLERAGRPAVLADRLRQMSREELGWRVRAEIRARTQEAATVMRTPAWRRADIRHALAVETLPGLDDAIAAEDWPTVHEQLLQVLRSRPSRFILNPLAAPEVRREVRARWPEAEADAVSRARAILDGRFDLLGYRGLRFSTSDTPEIDWHFDPVHQRRMPMAFWSRVPYLDPACGDHKVVWELNRQQHWFTLSRALWLTGDRSYADAIIQDLNAWMSANPPLMGVNWASMLELGFRTLSWMWGLHAMLVVTGPAVAGHHAAGPAEAGHHAADPAKAGHHVDADEAGHENGPWLVDLFVAVDRQLRHVEHNLSLYFSPNTHLTGEALALYVCGAALPEMAASTRWMDTGRRVLLREIDRQIERDGGHAERSTHYHRYTLDFYLLALLTARRIGDTEGEERFGEALRQLVPFARAMADSHGRLPRIGDDDAGRLWPIAGRDSTDIRDSLAAAAAVMEHDDWAPWGLTEEVLWLTSNDRPAFTRALRSGVDDRRVRERRTLPFRPAVRPDSRPERHSLLVFPGGERRRVAGERRGRIGERRLAPAERGGVDHRVTNVFADTGYVTSATDAGDHLIVDAGRHGYLNGGHAHADALSVVLSLRHKPLLVDPGTPTYTMDPALRDASRSSLGHNTVTIDNRSSAIPSGPFHWQTRTDARLELVRHNSRFSLIEASHEGYQRAGHRRVVLASDHGYLFVDVVTGSGPHEAAQLWHFDPRWRIGCEPDNALRLVHESGEVAWLLHDRGALSLVNSDDASPLGWVSPSYGVRVPTWSARVTETAVAPFFLVTWCGVAAGTAVPRLERVDAASDDDAVCIGAHLRCGSTEWVSIVHPGDVVARTSRFAGRSGVHSDARAVQCAFTDGALASVSLADGRRAYVTDELTIEADDVMADLHASLVGHRLELSASVPPAGLRVTGTCLERVQQITGNGHTLRRPGRPSAEVVLTAPDWSEPVTGVEFQDHHDVRYRRVR